MTRSVIEVKARSGANHSASTFPTNPPGVRSLRSPSKVLEWGSRAYARVRVAAKKTTYQRVRPFPTRVAIESASACNLACPMCPTPTKERRNGIMKVDVFRRAVDEMAVHGVERLFLHLWGGLSSIPNFRS